MSPKDSLRPGDAYVSAYACVLRGHYVFESYCSLSVDDSVICSVLLLLIRKWMLLSQSLQTLPLGTYRLRNSSHRLGQWDHFPLFHPL